MVDEKVIFYNETCPHIMQEKVLLAALNGIDLQYEREQEDTST
jgi:hypothetical protein